MKNKTSFGSIALKTTVVHTITYFVAGLLAFNLLNYSERFSDPVISSFMRQTDHPLVMAGVLFQPIRGFLFGIVFWLLKDILFTKYGWLKAWIMLMIVGIFSTFGAAPGSVEGFIYTIIPVKSQLGGLIEIICQSFLLAWLSIYWVNHSYMRWLNILLYITFIIIIILPVLGLLVSQAGLS